MRLWKRGKSTEVYLLAFIALASCARDSGERSVVTPLIELRIAHEVAAPELERLDFEGRTFYLETRSVLADDELEFVDPSVRGDTLMLRLRPTPEGAARLRKATEENIGKHLAFLLDSHVRNMPIIRSPIGGPVRSVSAGIALPSGEASRIADSIRSRWPRPPK